MWKQIKSEEGYTLLIAMLVLVLFSIIGISVMTLNLNSSTKNESRESTLQAQDLSMKGIEYVLKEIEVKMNEKLADKSRMIDFESEFEALLNTYKCKPNPDDDPSLSKTETGTATYCIEHLEPTNEPSKFQQTVTFRSTGKSNAKEQVTRATYILGKDPTGPNYAILTYEKDPTLPTKGNIELHGGLQVNGNILANNKLIISDKSRYKKSNVDSIYPIIKGGQAETASLINVDENNIVLEKNALGQTYFSENTEKFYEQNEFTIDQNLPQMTVNFDIFNKVNAKAYTNDSGVEVPTKYYDIITKENHSNVKITDYKTDANGQYILDYLGNKQLVSTYSSPKTTRGRNLNSASIDNAVFSSDQNTRVVIPALYNQQARFNLNWQLNGNNQFKSVSFPKDLVLKYGVKIDERMDYFNLSTNPRIKATDYVYVGRNMLVGIDHLDEVNFDLFNNALNLDALNLLSGLESISNIETPVHLDGTFYVNGNLVIAGARLTGNATFIVNGHTTIAFSEIGVDNSFNTQESNINIISRGEVKMSYIGNNHNAYYSDIKKINDLNINDPNGDYNLIKSIFTRGGSIFDPLKYLRDDANRSVFNGHIHSDKKITIDAATSYLTINGSLSAPEVYATSIKGRAEASCRDLGNTITNFLTPVVSPVLNFLGDLVGDVVSFLLGDRLGNTVKNVVKGLIGSNDSDNELVRVASADGRSSNCFLNHLDQEKDTLDHSGYLLNILGIDLVEFQEKYSNNDPRLIINYSPEPLKALRAKYTEPLIQYTNFNKLDPPQELSRN